MFFLIQRDWTIEERLSTIIFTCSGKVSCPNCYIFVYTLSLVFVRIQCRSLAVWCWMWITTMELSERPIGALHNNVCSLSWEVRHQLRQVLWVTTELGEWYCLFSHHPSPVKWDEDSERMGNLASCHLFSS